jgi:hypothetical protein
MNYFLLVGTSKGLVVLKNNHSEKFSIDTVHFQGIPVSMVYVDERTNTWWVGLSHRHWGEKLHFSIDFGQTWQTAGVPSYSGYDYRPGKPASLKKLWVMHHAGEDKPGCLWLGTEPGGLFYSDDNGKSFHLNEPLWNHPSRKDDRQWFGTGKDFPFIHSILVDPRNSDHVYLGVSCAGVFETTDGGKSWNPRNNGLVASYLPKTNAEIGHDPHQMLMCKSNPDVIWQQNHCGIFRTDNGAKEWKDVSGKSGFPSYGFALAIDDNNPEVAWVIPAESDESRIPLGLGLKVCITIDRGNNWKVQQNGLPQNFAFDLVLRQGFIKIDNNLIFGSTNGNLYLSIDKGENWESLFKNLAAVNSLVVSIPLK